jgi:hypothetical protein
MSPGKEKQNGCIRGFFDNCTAFDGSPFSTKQHDARTAALAAVSRGVFHFTDSV